MVTVKRALLSCHDKTGLEAFAKELAALGVELIASGGTAQVLQQAGLRVTSVEQFAGITEQLDGRVKTLHPKIHAGILARRDDPAHVTSVGPSGLIDLVVVNLYPFEQTVQRNGVTFAEAIEQIDIGGVTLLRAAAKNFAHVAVVSHPQQYAEVAEALRRGRGQLPERLAQQLAQHTFALTSRYDTHIAGFLSGPSAEPAARAVLPPRASIHVVQRQPLRYGENPHQLGGWYGEASVTPWGLGTLQQLQGKELSYNNLLDLDAALRVVRELNEPACVIIKHHAPCGLAIATEIEAAYGRAYACDTASAFGGVVGFNRPVDRTTAERLVSTFLEVIVAPSVEPAAAGRLAKKTSLRVVTVEWPVRLPQAPEWRQLLGGWLLQDPDVASEPPEAFRVATKRAPSAQERADLLFAWMAAKHVQSNGVVIVKDGATVGIGQGQPSRVGSVRLAVEKAGANSRGAVAASDGFFPFPDGVQALAAAGVTAVIQPGGSMRDTEVIAAADAANLAMLITGIRHFRH
ncbi:MAG: bifunctional phosphoribosylaminoimidazolecarboxamide formyltransferase/IMP cyclohydrolase [Candidatus Omnitrophica bacterium]|nr:bifunctional phosphoribosylaminoimidazolecarboxamide formyltransferase/IMP cyclohydrolase [Candidatus Omnitrophota bacterium]